MRLLGIQEVLQLHTRAIREHGGSPGLRDLAALESAVAQPRQSHAGEDLYASLPAKAAALCFFIVANHPFVDGNKRTGHAAMEVFLLLNDHELQASVDDAEAVVLGVASGEVTRTDLEAWVAEHTRYLGSMR